jgi:YVTN family beta-propeller protein
VAVDPTGKWVYVAMEQPGPIFGLGPTLVRVDTSSNTPIGGVNTTANFTGTLSVAVNAVGTRVYVANEQGDAATVDTASFKVVSRIFNTGGSSSGGIAVNPAGTRVYIATQARNGLGADGIAVIDTSTNTVIAKIGGVGITPYGVAVDPTGARVYVASPGSNTVAVIDASSNTVSAAIPVGASPLGVAINPAGTHVYVTNSGDNTVSVIDPFSRTVVATVGVGIHPLGIALNPAGTRAYVVNNGSDNVSVIDTSSSSVVATVGVGHLPFALGQFLMPASSPPATAAPPTLFLVGLGIAILAALQARRRFLLR